MAVFRSANLRRYVSNFWNNSRTDSVVKENVLASCSPNRVLLSYISHPFKNSAQGIGHTNIMEARELALVFGEMGYQVDVIDYDASLPASVNISEYKIVCGFGEPLEQTMRRSPPGSPIKINYMTGCHTYYSNQAGIRALQYVFSVTGMWEPTSLRLCNSAWPLQNTCPDHAIVSGNRFSKSVAEQYMDGSPVTAIPLFYLGSPKGVTHSNSFDNRRNNIIWFGSSGIVHKGLHLVLEAIKDWPELTLYVAGVPQQERAFFQRLTLHFGIEARVVDCGFLIPGSHEATEVLGRCGAVVAPSVSEGSAPAVLTAVFNGAMLPIIPDSASLDFGGLEINMGAPSLTSVKEAIGQYVTLKESDYTNRLARIMDEFSNFYSFDQFKERLRAAVAVAVDV